MLSAVKDHSGDTFSEPTAPKVNELKLTIAPPVPANDCVPLETLTPERLSASVAVARDDVSNVTLPLMLIVPVMGVACACWHRSATAIPPAARPVKSLSLFFIIRSCLICFRCFPAPVIPHTSNIQHRPCHAFFTLNDLLLNSLF